MTSHLKSLFIVGSLALLLSACGDNKTDNPTQGAAHSQPATPQNSVNQNNSQPTSHQDTDTNKATQAQESLQQDTTAQAIQPPSAETLKLGQARYEATCQVCHGQGLLDAPKLGDKDNWAKRQAQGIETLYMHSIKGFKKMPAQAVNGISEDEVKAAVDFMLVQAQ